MVQAGENATVTGTGSALAPFTVSAVTNCDEVRECLSAGDGIAYDPATGEIAVEVSSAAGNNLAVRSDGLFVPTGSATITAGRGLVGNGSASNPVEANTMEWPFPCDVDAQAGGVYSDANGRLRGDPMPRMNYYEAIFSQTYNNVAVPASETVVVGYTLVLPNVDPCRPAMAMVWQELDVEINLPANSGAMYGISTDDTWYSANRGSSAITATHTQTGRMLRAVIPAGDSVNFLLNVTMGRGSGGATYSQIQSYQRAWVFSLPN
ncbi:hypothetical protein AQJ30_15375 [Streptomyces longwoodensis]|uniref:Uncharacterized protein n=1 Tax=Streptomyces longwoodensis TaxID=68231 RepID=A0A117QN83_9ACTN|nr:hypothetical protein AQJ30_15375 [Streptomyces longwoodensis]